MDGLALSGRSLAQKGLFLLAVAEIPLVLLPQKRPSCVETSWASDSEGLSSSLLGTERLIVGEAVLLLIWYQST